ncbi:MAG: AAA family ATPase [Solirubrobacterales bacterium]|nr:AAA family ATPase [Solirubrobacterales bacterium]
MELRADPEESSSAGGLVGRDSELGRICRLIDPDDSGGGALVIHGDPGIGKTALLDEARRRAEQLRLHRLETGGVETETELPFAGLQRLLRPVLGAAEQLPARQRAALLGAVGTIEGSSPDLFLIALGAFNVVTQTATRGRLLLLVEDAQWLDRGTSEVLAFIARRVREEPIAILVAIRDGYGGPLTDTELDELPLSPLTETAASTLIDRRVPNLGSADRQRVLAEAGGNPLALIEFARAGSGHADCEWQLPPRLTLSERLERTFAARTEDLPDITRVALLVAATDDRDIIADVLGATSVYLGTPVNEQVLTPAIDVRLIGLEGIRIFFRNPLVRSAIYQAASNEQRRQAHLALAATLEGEPDRFAWHRAAAMSAPDEGVAAELESVAQRAERRGAIATTVSGLERAAMLSADSERRVDRLLHAAELAVELGRADLVGRMMARVDAENLTPLARARTASIRDRFDDRTPGDARQILGLVQDARYAAAEGDTDLALELLLGAAWRTWWTVTDGRVRDQVIGAVEAVAAEPADPRVLAVLAVAGPVKNAATVSERLTGIVIAPDDNPTMACLLGLSAHTIGQSELAVQVLAGAAVTMRAQGRLGLLARVLTMQAWSTIQLGNWNNVETLANEATRLARETGQPLWAAGAQAAEAAAAGIRGDIDLATELAAHVEREALPPQLSNILCVLQVARGVTALGVGRYTEAYEHLVRVFDPTDPAYHFAERHGALGYLVEAAVRTGHHDHARELVRDVERLSLESPATIIHLGLLYARPLVAAADLAEPGFLAALEADIGRSPFFRARVQLAYGEWLRHQRRIGESRVILRLARDAFDAIGARPWGDRVREQLRASGESGGGPAPVAVTAKELTPQERQIAELAAEGMTNREIGEQLFLSPRTVASHLYRLFPKLGIASRAELPRALARADDISAGGDLHRA